LNLMLFRGIRRELALWKTFHENSPPHWLRKAWPSCLQQLSGCTGSLASLKGIARAVLSRQEKCSLLCRVISRSLKGESVRDIELVLRTKRVQLAELVLEMDGLEAAASALRPIVHLLSDLVRGRAATGQCCARRRLRGGLACPHRGSPRRTTRALSRPPLGVDGSFHAARMQWNPLSGRNCSAESLFPDLRGTRAKFDLDRGLIYLSSNRCTWNPPLPADPQCLALHETRRLLRGSTAGRGGVGVKSTSVL
jgi:hypothetical protein